MNFMTSLLIMPFKAFTSAGSSTSFMFTSPGMRMAVSRLPSTQVMSVCYIGQRCGRAVACYLHLAGFGSRKGVSSGVNGLQFKIKTVFLVKLTISRNN